MSVTTPLAPTRRVAPAKARILETAITRFYQDGIRSVGVDRLIEESSVTKATFYKHYGSKDRLISDYVDALALRAVDDFDASASEASTPEELLRAWTDHLVDYVHGDTFRGDPFLNAAAEFADPAHPVRERITEHFETMTERFAGVLEKRPAEAGVRAGECPRSYSLTRSSSVSCWRLSTRWGAAIATSS